jgi:uncharacterized protein YdeI (BOF family)
MKESTLLKIALICSIVGLTALFFISLKMDYKDYTPSVLLKNAGESVKLSGVVSKFSQAENAAFIEINFEIPVTVVVFADENLTINAGDKIEVFGKVEDYMGKEEIIAQKIRVIS